MDAVIALARFSRIPYFKIASDFIAKVYRADLLLIFKLSVNVNFILSGDNLEM